MLVKINNWPKRPYFVDCELRKKNKKTWWVFVPRFNRSLNVRDKKLFEEWHDPLEPEEMTGEGIVLWYSFFKYLFKKIGNFIINLFKK